MAKPKLPKSLRDRIIELFFYNWSFEDVVKEVCEEALKYVESEQEVRNCVRRLKAEATRRRKRDDSTNALSAPTSTFFSGGVQPPIVKRKTTIARSLQRTPNSSIKVGSFDVDRHGHLRGRILATGSNNLAKERYFKIIARDVLENQEGFYPVIESPGQAVPFDFLAIKEGKPVLIELKGSLKQPQIPDEVQLVRMQDLLGLLYDIEIEPYLIQIHFDRGEYYLWYPQKMRSLFQNTDHTLGKHIPVRPTANWVRSHLRKIGGLYQLIEHSKGQHSYTGRSSQETILKKESQTVNLSDHIVPFGNLMHPTYYIQRKIAPNLSKNKMDIEIVWTYLVAKKYENDQPLLASKLCGYEESVPRNAKIWLEAYLYPTRVRREEGKYWKTRCDLAIGCMDLVNGSERQIRADGDWICIAESKWFDDIHPNPRFPNVLQFSQLIEHALLLHDKNGKFPERVHVTLITPKYFKDRQRPFSERNYWNKYQDYTADRKLLENDLRLCTLHFLKHDVETLIRRINALTLNWVTFEDLLALPDLVEHHVPGKYRATRQTWEQVFSEMDSRDIFLEMTRKVT